MRRLSILITALLSVGLIGSANASARELSDEQLYAFAGREAAIDMTLRNEVFADEDIRKQLTRVGLSEGCPAIKMEIGRLIETEAERLKPVVISAVEKMYPDGKLKGTVSHGLLLNTRGDTLLNIIKDDAKVIKFSELGRNNVATELDKLTDTKTAWQEPLSSWDFERNPALTFSNACLMVNSSDISASRRAFDPLHEKRGN